MSGPLQEINPLTLRQHNRVAKAFREQSMKQKILHLTLKRHWFDMIASGEKREEYRDPTDWILSRLKGKTYDVVRFRNGYNKGAPVVVCKFLGWRWGVGKAKWGGRQDDGPYVIIRLGPVLRSL